MNGEYQIYLDEVPIGTTGFEKSAEQMESEFAHHKEEYNMRFEG